MEKMQDAFLRTAFYLMQQEERSHTSTGCQYRAPDGNKCAVGFLIPDEKYHPTMEGRGAVSMTLDPALGHYTSAERLLLEEIQTIHDCYSKRDLEFRMVALSDFEDIATSHKMSSAAIGWIQMMRVTLAFEPTP